MNMAMVDMAGVTEIPEMETMGTASTRLPRRRGSRRAVLTLLGAGVLGAALTGTGGGEAEAWPRHWKKTNKTGQSKKKGRRDTGMSTAGWKNA